MLCTLDHAREEMNALAEGAEGRIALGALLVAAADVASQLARRWVRVSGR